MRQTHVFTRLVCILSTVLLARGSGICKASTPPSITLVGISDVTTSTAVISWLTDVPSDSQVEYGTTFVYDTFTTLDPEIVTQHKQSLSGLEASTTYHFRVMSRDAAGHLAISLWDYTFRTADLPDQVPPVISAVATADITSSEVTIYWKTNEPSDSQIAYGETAQYGRLSVHDRAMVTIHSLALTNLSAGTTYHCQVMSRDETGNLGTSGDLAFSTLENAPIISHITVSGVSARVATISWNTDVASDTQITYGTTDDCSISTDPDPIPATIHVQQLTGLEPETTYYFRVRSKRATSELGISDLGSFETTADRTLELRIPRLATTEGHHQDGLDDSMYTGIAIANLGGHEAVLTFTAYDAAGNTIAGAGIVNPSRRVLPAGNQLTIVDAELFGPGFAMANPQGWIDIVSSTNAVTGFTTLFNASVSVLDGVPMFTQPVATFVFPHIDEQGPTELYIANSNPSDAVVELALVGSHGLSKSRATRTIAPLGALAESAASLFPDAIPTSSDSIRVTPSMGVAAYELLGEAPRDVAGLNAFDAAAGATTLYCPQYVGGRRYRSTLSIVDIDVMDGNLTLRLFGDNGMQIGTQRTVPIAPHGKVLISDPTFFGLQAGDEVSGYVEIESSGPRITGSVLIEDAAGTALKTALPLVSQLQEALVFSQVVSNASYYTGLALLNPGEADVTTSIGLYSSDGSLKATTSLLIPAHNRVSRLVSELFPAVAEQDSGYIRIAGTGALAGFSVFGTHDVKILSAVPAQIGQ